MEALFDVIVVGAGPAGSSAAAFLSRKGVNTLLLDRAHFPREKVCGDGITPKALYWLDRLGCVDEVLEQAGGFYTDAEIFIDGQRALTGSFCGNTAYPHFAVLLERKKLDYILVRHAVACGAMFRPGCEVKGLSHIPGGIAVDAVSAGGPVRFTGKLVIGADGANSMISRAMGNRVLDGTTAVSLRIYYENARVDGSHIQIHFDQEFFPGYGWMFVDDTGKANVGVGFAVDRTFPLRANLHSFFERFVATNLKDSLRGARPLGKPKGGWACFYRPAAVVKDRALLVGDAANLADPVSGGGIHNAIESGWFAAETAAQAVAQNDFSAASLARYEALWGAHNELDWRTGDFLLSIAKNPHLRDFYLYLVRAVVTVARQDRRFRDFASGIFSGGAPARKVVCPEALRDAVPADPTIWLEAFLAGAGKGLPSQLVGALRKSLRAARGIAGQPLANVDWGLEVLAKSVRLAECYAKHKVEAAA